MKINEAKNSKNWGANLTNLLRGGPQGGGGHMLNMSAGNPPLGAGLGTNLCGVATQSYNNSR